jgi:hypothetical protein
VAGISLFAGFYFRSWMIAAALPLSIMAISDCWIGGYAPQMMALVYAMLALPVACRGWLRRLWNAPRYTTRKPLTGLLGCSFLASCTFSWSGLVECYVSALPFFRYTLAGDLFYSLVLFGGYNLAWSAGFVSQPVPAYSSRTA